MTPHTAASGPVIAAARAPLARRFARPLKVLHVPPPCSRAVTRPAHGTARNMPLRSLKIRQFHDSLLRG
jgi:hypothetical protein